MNLSELGIVGPVEDQEGVMDRRARLEALWPSVQAGDRSALDALFTEWAPVVLRWCRRLGGPAIDAEQAAQEALIVMFRRLHTVAVPRAFPSWTFSVVRNTVRDRRREAFGRRWDPEADVPAMGVEMDVQGRDELEQVWQVLEGLSPDLREVLVLCDVEQRTDPEAAELIGIPVGTAKSRLRRARAKLREEAQRRGLRAEGSA